MPPIQANTHDDVDMGWAGPPERNYNRWPVSYMRTVLPGESGPEPSVRDYNHEYAYGYAPEVSAYDARNNDDVDSSGEEEEDEDDPRPLAERITERLYEWGWEYNPVGQLVPVVVDRQRMDRVGAHLARIEEGEWRYKQIAI